MGLSVIKGFVQVVRLDWSVWRGITIAMLILLSNPVSAIVNMSIPDGITVVAAPQVREMKQSGEYVLINSLSKIEFRIQHIPGSINIPVDESLGANIQNPQFPQDKSTALIFYCMGDVCPYSRIAAIEAVKSGYKKVFWFRGGVMQWRKYQYPMNQDKHIVRIKVDKLAPDDFQEAHFQQKAFLLDVRPKWFSTETDTTFTNQYIANTDISIPLVDLSERIGELPKDRPILISDGKMLQSINAAKYLISEGYSVVGVLKGGVYRWMIDDYPVVNVSE